MPHAYTQGLFDGPVDRLPAIQRDQLRRGQVVVTGKDGRYTARILVNGSMGQVWSVLTDYGNLSRFIPNITVSRILEDRGEQKVVEQVDRRQVFLVSVVSRTVLQIREEDRQKINFRLLEGDLQTLEGTWLIEPVSFVPRTPPTQVLITYTVHAQPLANIPADAFYEIFTDSLTDTLTAIAKEVTRRSN
ncbi:MAG: SRPBCC family protein [Pseudanabaenaceae cyanobacterium]